MSALSAAEPLNLLATLGEEMSVKLSKVPFRKSMLPIHPPPSGTQLLQLMSSHWSPVSFPALEETCLYMMEDGVE